LLNDASFAVFTEGATVKTGMSGGTVFLIILLCVIPVYLGVGMLYNWKLKGKALGKESIPNIEFWTDLPNLIKVRGIPN
jgi:hypothetical protein